MSCTLAEIDSRRKTSAEGYTIETQVKNARNIQGKDGCGVTWISHLAHKLKPIVLIEPDQDVYKRGCIDIQNHVIWYILLDSEWQQGI